MNFIELLARDDISALRLFINKTKDINKTVIADDGHGLNYLHICAANDSEKRNEVLEILLARKDLNINAYSGHSNNFWTALHFAASVGYDDTILLLLEKGADPYITDANGFNVWDIANQFSYFACINTLESHANKDLSQQFTTLCLAEEEKDIISGTDVFDLKTLVEVESNESSKSNSSQETIVYELNSDRESKKNTKIYFDTASNLSFVERKLNPKLDVDLNDNKSHFDTWSCSMIESKRSDLGLSPVPVTPTTRAIYAKNTYLIEKNLSPSPVKKALQYSEELHLFMSGEEHKNRIKSSGLEREFNDNFNGLKSPRSCFTYILLDPRVTNDIQSQTNGQMVFNPQLFQKFIESVFYIGKGQKSRPMQHLFEARTFMGKRGKGSVDKVQRIKDIWSAGRGVVSLNCFHNISSSEALSREFCMLSAIGIENVTNVLRGNNTLKKLKWNDHKQNYFGSFLLLKAYYMVIVEGEREIRPADIKKK